MSRHKASNPLIRQALGVASFGVTSAAAVASAFGQTVAANERGNDKTVETVEVTARKSTLDALPEKILNTPQSINVVPAEVIREQGVSNLQDALKNVPGITLNAGEGGAHGDLVNLRGFSAGDDFFLDGLRDTGLYTRDAFDYDAVEVYKGPASTLFGRGSTGGVINQVTKSPELRPINDATFALGTNDEVRGTADINAVLGDSSAIRVALMGQRSGVADRPFVKNQRWGIAPSFATGIGTDTSFVLKYLHQQEDDIPDYGVPFLFGVPAPVPRNTFYGLPSDDRFKSEVDVVTGRVEHRFNDVLSIGDTARYGHYWFDSRQTAPIYGSANCYTVAPYSGAPLCSATTSPVPVTSFNPLYPVLGTPLSRIFVERDRPSSKGIIATMMNSTDLTARFSTGLFRHTLIVGVEVDREDADLTRFVNQNTAIAPTPLLAPDPFEAFPGHQTAVRQRPVTKTGTVGLYAVDTVDIGEHWNVVGAIRFDRFSARFDQTVGTPSHFTHVDNIASPRAAIVFKPTENYSLYLSYGTSFNPSAENLSLAASNADLGPERDRTFEAGAKAQMLNGTLSLTAAAFNTVMTNARITDPLNPSLQTLAGTLRVNGLEFDAAGYITSEWEITGGYTYIAPLAVGLVAVGVPGPIPNTARNQANLWTTYEFDDDLKIGIGLNYVGRRDAGADNATAPGSVIVAKVPAYVTWDAMIGYQFTDTFGLQLNGYNLTDEYYFANSYFTRPGENHTVPGAGRTFLLTANVSL
jgi:catecholate siderophore receptor